MVFRLSSFPTLLKFEQHMWAKTAIVDCHVGNFSYLLIKYSMTLGFNT